MFYHTCGEEQNSVLIGLILALEDDVSSVATWTSLRVCLMSAECNWFRGKGKEGKGRGRNLD